MFLFGYDCALNPFIVSLGRHRNGWMDGDRWCKDIIIFDKTSDMFSNVSYL